MFNQTQLRTFQTTCRNRSKIGKQALRIPTGVELSLFPYSIANPPPPNFKSATQALAVKGPLGSLVQPLLPFTSVSLVGEKASVLVTDPEDKRQRAMWGTTRRLLENMVTGVSEGVVVPMRLVGVGYRAALEEKDGVKQVTLKLGHSHPVIEKIPDGVDVNVPTPQRLILSGIDKQKVTQFAANIRKHRPPEPYNQKGVFVGDETIKKKEGKKR
ncbi:ribosomal protein L6, alpha-beta domain-containing protein [Obelidium mucronatum]|nr:ribosomal protein L6, alpha-beta domain-containing protein [Obelidium mucronatum]